MRRGDMDINCAYQINRDIMKGCEYIQMMTSMYRCHLTSRRDGIGHSIMSKFALDPVHIT